MGILKKVGVETLTSRLPECLFTQAAKEIITLTPAKDNHPNIKDWTFEFALGICAVTNNSGPPIQPWQLGCTTALEILLRVLVARTALSRKLKSHGIVRNRPHSRPATDNAPSL